MNKNIHQRYIAPAEMLHGSSRYVKWTDPFEVYPSPKKKVKRKFYGSQLFFMVFKKKDTGVRWK